MPPGHWNQVPEPFKLVSEVGFVDQPWLTQTWFGKRKDERMQDEEPLFLG